MHHVKGGSLLWLCVLAVWTLLLGTSLRVN